MANRINSALNLGRYLLVICTCFLFLGCGGGGGGGGSGGGSNGSATSSVSTNPTPTLSVSAASYSVAYGGNTTITWSSANTTSCTLAGVGTAVNGSFNTGALNSSTNYMVTCTGPNGTVSSTASVNVAPPAVTGCSTTGATSAISLSSVPSRLTGVAPLSVFFDGAGTVASSASKPYLDLEYRWDFGDVAGSPVSGMNWQYGSKANLSSRNIALGPQASHVFETPGTYAITLSVTDGSNTVTNNCIRIVVLDPNVSFAGTNTVCFSTAGIFTGCPTGSLQVRTSDFPSAVNSYKGTNKRLLFRRGDVFNSGSVALISVNGPGIIGAYGNISDPKPVILRTPGSFQVIVVGTTKSTGDWRIMDLEINGQNVQEPYNRAIDSANEFHQLLMLRMYIHGTWRGVVADDGLLSPGQKSMDEWTLMDSTLTGIPGCTYIGKFDCDWRVMISGTRHAIQGNSLDNEDTGGSHVIRSFFLHKGVISNNYIARAGIIEHAIKIHSWAWAGGSGGNSVPGTYSEEIIISDNKIVGGINPWTVSVAPQNDQNDERVRNVVIERNWFVSGSNTNISVDISASNVAVRNNIFTLATPTGTNGHVGVLVQQRGVEPAPDDVRIFGNSFYSKTVDSFSGVQVGVASNIAIKNNVAWAPFSSVSLMTAGSGLGNSVQSNNSTNIQVKSADPHWASASPVAPSDFKIGITSYAFGMAGAVPSSADFFLQTRYSNSIGAVEP